MRIAAAIALAFLAACGAPQPGAPTSTGALVTPGLGPTLQPTSTSTGAISVGSSSPVPIGAVSNLGVVPPADAEADAFAVAFLNSIQARSFRERREFCGYFILDAGGQIRATPPVRGTLASCTQPAPSANAFASYHTHGAFDFDYDNEVPSPEDMIGDFAFGIDGYISTPGGRIWRVDVSRQVAVQVCSLGCVLVDTGFIPRNEGAIPPTMTVQQVANRF